jgi:hypothetical protein
MIKLELLSKNLIIIINKALENQNIIKMVDSNSLNPFLEADVNFPKTLFMFKVFPYPFENAITDERTELRIYLSETGLNSGVIEDTDIFFDIITHKNLYLIKDSNNNTLIRTMRIAQEIINIFDDKSIETVGRLKFNRIINLPVDDNFQATRMIASMITIGE